MPFGTFTEYPLTNTSITSSELGKWTQAPAIGDRAMEEGDLESGRVSFGFRGSIQRVFLNVFFFKGRPGGSRWRPVAAVMPCTTAL